MIEFLRRILRLLTNEEEDLEKLSLQVSFLKNLEQKNSEKLGVILALQQVILALLQPPPPAEALSFVIQFRSNMPNQKAAGVDFKIVDDGSGDPRAIASAVDAIGEPTVFDGPPPTWAVANADGTASTILTLAPDLTTDSQGLNAKFVLALPSPPPVPLPGGFTVSLSGQRADGTLLAGKSATVVDIVAGGATGFMVVEK